MKRSLSIALCCVSALLITGLTVGFPPEHAAIFKREAVAADHAEASKAGAEILAAGGNAADAAAATMLALGADTIQMGPLSYLTAVDTSLEHDLSPLDHTNQLVPVSNDEVDRVIRLWRDSVGTKGDGVNPYQELYKYVHPLVVGALDRASSLSLMLCREILAYHMKDTRKAQRIAKQLNSSYPAHQYPITSREARRLGLDVRDISEDLEPLLQELNLLYSEMGQRAITDYDETNHHDNEITNILEGKGAQVIYQIEKDWHYRKEERRFVSMNDVSAWYHCAFKGSRVVKEKLHIR